MASWRGERIQDLHGEARLSWITHLVSYAVALVGLFGCMAASADAGWSSNAAVLLGLALLLILAAQVLAGVQYLRPSGPPGHAAGPHAPTDRAGAAARGSADPLAATDQTRCAEFGSSTGVTKR